MSEPSDSIRCQTVAPERGPDGRFRSGPGHPGRALKGNLSAARRSGMHRAFFRRLALPKKYRFILPLIDGRIAMLADDKGGPEKLSGAQVAMLDLYRRAHGASLLLLCEAHDKGYIREDEKGWDLHPGAKEMARFAELERKILLDFGLKSELGKYVNPVKDARDTFERLSREKLCWDGTPQREEPPEPEPKPPEPKAPTTTVVVTPDSKPEPEPEPEPAPDVEEF